MSDIRLNGSARSGARKHRLTPWRGIALAALVAALVTPAWASEEGGGAVSPFAGDLGGAIWTLVIFLLVVFVLGKFAWGPILAALQKREQFIYNSLAQAKRDREEAEKRLAEHSARLHKAGEEASAIVAEGRRDAEVVRQSIKEEAQKEAQAMLERAKREINLARDTAVKEIYELGAQLATDAAAKILGRQLNAQDHERLIQDSIEEIASRRR